MVSFTPYLNCSFPDDIAAYFGVKVALYFAWLGHYTCALCVPAVLGTILYAGLWGRGQVRQMVLACKRSVV